VNVLEYVLYVNGSAKMLPLVAIQDAVTFKSDVWCPWFSVKRVLLIRIYLLRLMKTIRRIKGLKNPKTLRAAEVCRGQTFIPKLMTHPVRLH
jgi:hypothetical protein